ncbi:MAG TPA: hypothetical protein VFO58_12875, partial [Vicinamibacterales bacterium]|nr:hypothetical protein [Vicinamibacterales bacterium]
HVVEAALAATVEKVGLFPNRFESPALPLVEMPDFEERIIVRDADRGIATFALPVTKWRASKCPFCPHRRWCRPKARAE